MSVSGPKILLLDDETATIIGLVYTQTELLAHDVVLIETLRQVHEKKVDQALSQIQCIALVRPTLEEIKLELQSPHFGSYYLFFTNVLSESLIRELAQSDHQNKVMIVHEVFMDIYSLNKRIFSLGMDRSLKDLLINRGTGPKMQRMVDGLFSLLCSMKLRCNIRYDVSSPLCRTLAEQLKRQIDRHDSYFQKSDKALIFLIDRRTDPITPMVHGWSYLEILHDTLGIKNNIVNTPGDSSVKQYVLDERTDNFLESKLTLSYKDLVDEVTKLSDSVKQQPNPSVIKDLDELKSYIQNYPKYQENSNLAVKHVSLLTAANRILQSHHIFAGKANAQGKGGDISTGIIEQDIAMNTKIDNSLETITRLLREEPGNPEIERLSLLFASKYEQSNESAVQQLKDALSVAGKTTILNHMKGLLEITGKSFMTRDSSFAGKALDFLKNFAGSNEHPLMRYHPPLEQLIASIKERRVPNSFACFECGEDIPRKIIIFYIGGATYAEGKLAYTMSDRECNIIVGGTTVHNFESFVNEVA